MTTHAQAREYATKAFIAKYNRVPSLHEAQVMCGVGFLESHYSDSWRNDGTGSFNVGCIQKSKPPCDPDTSFKYTDTHPNADGTSTPYSVCFWKYPTPEMGWTHFTKILYVDRPTVLAAATKGDLYNVSYELRRTTYYEGFGATRAAQVANHLKALTSAVKAQCLALGEPFPDSAASFRDQVGKVVGSVIPVGTRTLRRGMRGDDVKAWQMALNQTSGGFMPIVTDGCFGPNTEYLTGVWQKAHGLVADSVVGKKTRAAMTAALKQAS